MSVLRATPKDRETAALLAPASRAVNDGLELIRTNRRRPATAPTTPSSAAGKASPYPLLGERPLELGERSENTEHAVVRQPKSLSFTEAASVWMMFVTAYGERIYRASQTSSKRQPLNRLFTIIVSPFTCWCQHVAERR